MAILDGIESASVGRLYSVLVGQPSPVFLLGAGASVRSGVPLASGVVERAAKWAFARDHGRSPEDPRLLRSDWLPWLERQPWFDTAGQSPMANNYHAAVAHLLQPRQARADFFRSLLQTGAKPSIGYERLAEFLHQGFAKTVLTTNFDTLLLDAKTQLRRPHHIDVIQTNSDYTKFSTSPIHPQLIYLHGSVEHYTDKNMLDEVQHLDPLLVTNVFPLVRDHPLIVVGYRGGEPSVMRHLLLENADQANNYRHGILWCKLASEGLGDISPLVLELANAIGSNFSFVDIESFDDLLAKDLWGLHQDNPTRPVIQAATVTVPPATEDMSPVRVAGLDDVDWPTVRSRIMQYCRALQIWVPADPDRAWVIEQLLQANLAVSDQDKAIRLTRAGCLLFGKHPQSEVPEARVVLRAKGSPSWLDRAVGLKEGDQPGHGTNGGELERLVEGNLWAQYEAINDFLAAFNRPFRLKGEQSEMVLPYPPLALKEVVVNALVHRDYMVASDILIEVSPGSVRISNPGGLVAEVQRRVEAGTIEEEIRKGRRGIKGYRNPVLADLFYGGGEMDKAGSGLSDMYRAIRANGGDVKFGPTESNDAFDVLLLSRPEAVDEVTNTATPTVLSTTTFAANMLEVLELPDRLFHAGTPLQGYRDIGKAMPRQWWPPYILHEGRIYTFHNFDDPANPLRAPADDGDWEALSVSEFAAEPDGERRLVWLLNLALEKHFERRGLIVDRKRKRAYFPKTEAGIRTITYQARLRRATRTVVKPRVSSHTNRIMFWEHEALGYRFEKFGSNWALFLEPGYVFTFDGQKGLLAPEKVNKLSTKRAARDYNSAVHNDLSFWAWFVASGAASAFSLDLELPPLRIEPEGEETDEDDDRWSEVLRLQAMRARDAEDIASPRIILSSRLPSITVNDLKLEPAEEPVMANEQDLQELDQELEQLAEDQRLEARQAGQESKEAEAEYVDQP